MSVHPTAIVHPKAKIGKNVSIGPYVVIDENVTIGDGTRVMHGAHITGWAEIGKDNEIHIGAVIGHVPQDRNFKGEKSFVTIGDRNIIREYVTIHRGTTPDSATTIGDNNFLMGLCHIAHNCQIGNNVVIGNASLLGGYVMVEDKAFISGDCGIHQFVRIGTLALLGGIAQIKRDIPPYMLVDLGGKMVVSWNKVGIRKASFAQEIRNEIKGAFLYLYRSPLNTTQALEEIEAHYHSKEIQHLVDFIRHSKRGIQAERRKSRKKKEENP